jgi:diguanylate cyclase (GGDEF)-like protein
MKFSLKGKIQLLISAVIIFLCASIAVGLTLITERQINRELDSDTSHTSRLLGVLITQKSDDLTQQCILLARQPFLRALVSTHDTPTISDSLGDYVSQLGATCAVINDNLGGRLGAAGQNIPSVDEVSNGITTGLDGKDWSGIISTDGRLFVAVTVPIYNGADLWGTLSAYKLMDAQLSGELKNIVGADVAFVDNGTIVDSSIPLGYDAFSHDGQVALIDIGGSRYFGESSPLPLAGSLKLKLITLLPYDSEMRVYRRFEIALVALFIVAFCVALAIGSAFSNGLVKPLSRVVDAAKVIQQGQWPDAFIAPGEDEVGLLQQVFNDMIVSLRNSRERLESLVDTDLLTGLVNHRRFQERLVEETQRAVFSGEPLCLALCDIDTFKDFNRREGPAKGDEAITRIAAAIRSAAPDGCLISRYSGNQFALLLIGFSTAQAQECACVILRAIAILEVGLTASAGCAQFGEHSAKPEGLMLATELALSRAKQLGGNQVCLFETIPGADEMADPYQLDRYLNDGSLATIQALAAAVDAKDSYTRGHSANVAVYASDLAGYLGYSTAFVDLIYITGTLHDVGKIGVPDAILKKPDKLTQEERAVMETHPVLGELIVKKAPQLASSLSGVRNHHERWDGKGYPDMLVGNDIPLMARILAVADTYDAMTSDRPYRKGLSIEYALNEIGKGSETQFDPQIAKAFVQLMKDSSRQPKLTRFGS